MPDFPKKMPWLPPGRVSFCLVLCVLCDPQESSLVTKLERINSFFMVQLLYPYRTTGKIIALTMCTLSAK